jgi:hypothetical protein
MNIGSHGNAVSKGQQNKFHNLFWQIKRKENSFLGSIC